MTAGLTDHSPIRYCLSNSFELFEQFADTARDWELDFRQLGVANSPFQLQQMSAPRMLFARAKLDSHFYQRGGPAIGFRSFALHTDSCSDYQWCGERADPQSLVVMPEDGQFESVSRPGFDVFTLSLSTALLTRTAEVEFERSLTDFIGPGGEVCYRAGNALREIRTLLHSLSKKIADGHDRIASRYGAAGLSRIERKLAHLVLSCLERGDKQAPRGPRNKRMLALNRALEVIEHTPPTQLCMSDLVEQTGASRRTIEYAFRDSLGLSPAHYIKALRLRAFHKGLLAEDTRFVSVADLGARHGFNHTGQLAVDYRGMFGELPSATLRRDQQQHR